MADPRTPYRHETVKKILAAMKAKPARIFSNANEFIKWLKKH